MMLSEVQNILPNDWYPMDVLHHRYEVIQLIPYSNEYETVEWAVKGDYYEKIENIYKIQNPILYAKFHFKCHEYNQRGPFEIKRLYHDTTQANAESICKFNLDWRYGQRYKHGFGVYFADTPATANRLSSKKNGRWRSMFIVDVLVQNVQLSHTELCLPDIGYDTVINEHNNTYVKYYDAEYYPVYVVNYQNAH